jgi:hypothetical protein
MPSNGRSTDFFFKTNKNSNLQLVIEGPLSEDKCLNKYCMNPNDIYFEGSYVMDIHSFEIKQV